MDAQNAQVTVVVKRPVPLIAILTIIFVLAKLAAVIDWSWWLVFAPLWALPALVVGFYGLVVAGAGLLFMGALVVAILGEVRKQWRQRQTRKSLDRAQRILDTIVPKR